MSYITDYCRNCESEMYWDFSRHLFREKTDPRYIEPRQIHCIYCGWKKTEQIGVLDDSIK